MKSKRFTIICFLAVGVASLLSLSSVEARRATTVTAPAADLAVVQVSPS
jgi:hypothetical protein